MLSPKKLKSAFSKLIHKLYNFHQNYQEIMQDTGISQEGDVYIVNYGYKPNRITKQTRQK